MKLSAVQREALGYLMAGDGMLVYWHRDDYVCESGDPGSGWFAQNVPVSSVAVTISDRETIGWYIPHATVRFLARHGLIEQVSGQSFRLTAKGHDAKAGEDADV